MSLAGSFSTFSFLEFWDASIYFMGASIFDRPLSEVFAICILGDKETL